MKDEGTFKATFFDEYTDEVCKYVSLRHRADVKEELLYHLEENYKAFSMLGLGEQEAAEKAIQKMGDKTALSEKFKKVYENPFFSELRSSVNFIIWGIIFYNFFLNLFSGSQLLAKAIGAFLLLFGMYRMRKIDKKITASMAAFSVSLGVLSVAELLTCYGGFDYVMEIVLANQVLCCLAHILLFAGLDSAVKREIQEGDKKPNILFWGVSWALSFSLLAFIATENSDLGIFAYLFLIHTVCMFLSLRRVRNVIGRKESEIFVRQRLNRKEKLIFSAISLLLVIALPLGSMYFGYTREPKSEKYSVSDINLSAKESETARAHLFSLGLSADIIDDLPDSEVVKYKDATNMLCTDFYYNGSEISIKKYAFVFPQNRVRVLYRICDFDLQKRHYREGFFYQFPEFDFANVPTEEQTDNELCLILSDKGGKTYRSKPIDSVNHRVRVPTFYGSEFSFVSGAQNRRAYFASSAYVQEITWRSVYVNSGYYHQNYPINLGRDSFIKMSENRFYTGTTTYVLDDFTYSFFAFYCPLDPSIPKPDELDTAFSE